MEHQIAGDRAKGRSIEQIGAMTVANRVSVMILSERQDILSAIVDARLKDLRYEDIAADPPVDAMFQELGVEAGIRTSVISRICRQALNPDLNRAITSKILSRRPSNLDQDAMRRGVEINQIYPWTPAIDEYLLHLCGTCTHESGRCKDRTDWVRFTQEVRKVYPELTRKNLENRIRYLKSRMS